MELATFGMPPILVATPGEPVVRLRCNNPPVSVYVDTFRTTRHDLGGARSVLLHTDGLNEALTAAGELYRDHLEAHLQACISRAQLWKAFEAEVPAPDDDVTFLLLTRVDAAPLWQDALTIESRLDKVEEAIQQVEQGLATALTLDADARFEFAMAIREALLNAYEHGSLEINATEKHRLLKEGLFYEHLLERETTQDRLITLEGSFHLEGANHLLKVTVTDEGPGFTPPRYWFNEPDSILLNGRGLKMVRKYTDAFYFNEKGNAITLVKIYGGGSDGTGADECERDHHHREHQDHR
jgi:anti-sigma regulatory factor (Ser/Thr protein kinase)